MSGLRGGRGEQSGWNGAGYASVEMKSASSGAGHEEEEGEEEEGEEEGGFYPSGMIGAFGNHMIRRVINDRGDDERAVVYHL